MSETQNWVGRSGTSYLYEVYEHPHKFGQVEGNYIYTKKIANYWEAIYIGEGNLADRGGPSHQQAGCISSKGATHIHAHSNPVEAARKSEEKDLLARHPEAYAPKGCNVKEGG